MIDKQAISLVEATKAVLARMKDARPSERLAVSEKFGEMFIALLKKATEGISNAEKIKLFDDLLAAQVKHFTTQIQERMDGTYCEDNDHPHYTYNEVVTGTLGPEIYKAFYELETIFSRQQRF